MVEVQIKTLLNSRIHVRNSCPTPASPHSAPARHNTAPPPGYQDAHLGPVWVLCPRGLDAPGVPLGRQPHWALRVSVSLLWERIASSEVNLPRGHQSEFYVCAIQPDFKSDYPKHILHVRRKAHARERCSPVRRNPSSVRLSFSSTSCVFWL